MHHNRKPLFPQILNIPLLLCFILIGCGRSGVASTTAPAAPPPVDALALNNAASADIAGLHIEMQDPLKCEGQIVLKDIHRTLDQAAISQINAFLSDTVISAYPVTVDMTNKNIGQVTVPDAMQLVLGSVDDRYSTIYWFSRHDGQQYGCTTNFYVTNTSQQTIQLTQLGVTYTRASQPNTFLYHQIDACTVIGCGPCQACGAGPGCEYVAHFDLSPGAEGTHVDVPIKSINGDRGCSLPIMLGPGETQYIFYDFSSKVSSQLYHVDLTMTENTVSGTQTVTMPSTFSSNIVFADSKQFDCFALQGNAFVKEATPGRGCI